MTPSQTFVKTHPIFKKEEPVSLFASFAGTAQAKVAPSDPPLKLEAGKCYRTNTGKRAVVVATDLTGWHPVAYLIYNTPGTKFEPTAYYCEMDGRTDGAAVYLVGPWEDSSTQKTLRPIPGTLFRTRAGSYALVTHVDDDEDYVANLFERADLDRESFMYTEYLDETGRNTGGDRNNDLVERVRVIWP